MFMNRNVLLMSDDTCLLFLLPVSGQRGCHTGWSFHFYPIFLLRSSSFFLCLSLYTPTGSPFVLLFFFSAPENQSGLLVSALLWLGSRHPNKPDLDQTGLPLSEAIHSDHLPFFPYSRVPASSVFSRPKPVLYIVTNVTAEDLFA
ncbi:hypothetical protein BDW60DRAFT_12935 [Aspergillus nidulans var. acristatus]